MLSRRPIPAHIPASEKVTRIEHSNFLEYPSELLAQLEGHSACIWALGKSSVGMNEEEYTRLTHDFPVTALKTFAEAGSRGEDSKFRFVHISGDGARTDEKGVLFARVKVSLATMAILPTTSTFLRRGAPKRTSLHLPISRPPWMFTTSGQGISIPIRRTRQ